MGKKKLVSLLLMLLLSSISSYTDGSENSACAGALPTAVKSSLRTDYPKWNILTSSDLVQEDKEIWERYHKGACPGLAELKSSDPTQYAILLVRPMTRSARLVLAQKRQSHWKTTLLYQETNTSNFPVIYSAKSGKYRDLISGKKVHVNGNAIIYEHIEASAILFYEKRGQYRHSVISQ